MKIGLVAILLLGFLGISSCNTCNSCEPFKEEPFVKVRFFNLADSSKKILIIDSINSIAGKEIRQFQDTTYQYRFPLNMHQDSAQFKMVYRDPTQLDVYHTNLLTLTYSRQFEKRDDNYIVVRCLLESLTSDFYQKTVICNENSTLECLSNEAIIKIYN